MRRPLKEKRIFGPALEFNHRETSDSFNWAVDDEIAHHIYDSTIESDEVGFGSFTILVEAFMNFFDERSKSDSLNNWFFTRDGSSDYDIHDWIKVPRRLDIENPEGGEEVDNGRLFDESITPNAEAVKVTSQQYTTNGALFTYEFDQNWHEPGSAFVRVPVPRELTDEAKDIANGTKFEFFEFQSREYREQFAVGGTPKDRPTFSHPHFRADDLKSPFEIKVFIDNAFDVMERGVRLENR